MSDAAFSGAAVATSSATKLALVLTAIGIAHRANADFDQRFDRNAFRVADIRPAPAA